MPRIAVDLLGGDAGPGVVADALAHYLAEPHAGSVCIVGPSDVARDLLAARGVDVDHRVDVMHAGECVPMTATSHETLAMIREDDTLSSVVGVQALRTGRADAFVSIGHTGATVAASSLGLGRLPGMGRLGLAVELPSLSGPVILLDCGAAPHATAEDLVRFAAVGRAYAIALGVAKVRVGLLSIGSERGKGDHLRKRADHLLSEAFDPWYAGPLEGHDLITEPRAEVVVVDGFTGNVALKSMEGALRWSVSAMAQAYGAIEPAREVVRTSHFLSGGALLGLAGNVVVGHGASSATEVLACIRRAATMSVGNVVGRVRDALSEFAPLDSRGEPE
jgi:glycerol-3-phosphate acyltransferase PlsX